ncbi:MAG: CHAT domain-containing protein [Saprospiraceae bacterium]|nr:CHAT domain-containing protein [Saprospiraceae bacterium]
MGKDDPKYASCQVNLAIVYKELGEYEQAESLYLEAREIFEKSTGKEDRSYASTVLNLGVLYYIMGHYDKAEIFLLESLTIFEHLLGKDHPIYSYNLGNLGSLYWVMGQYDKAEPFYLETKAIRENHSAMNIRNMQKSLINLGYCETMGQYEKVEPLYLEAKSILERSLGMDHPSYARVLEELAIYYFHQRKFEQALPLLLEALSIFEKVYGKEDLDYANSLYNMGGLYLEMNDYKRAEPYYLEAKSIREKVLGTSHYEYALSLNSLGRLYRNMGDYKKAEPLCLEAKAIQEKVFGREHPKYADRLNSLGALYWEMGQYEKAEPYYLELSALNQTIIRKALDYLSEEELNNYLNLFVQRRDQILSSSQVYNSEKLIGACFDNSLFYKGFLLNASNQLKSLATSSPEATETYTQLKDCGRQLAQQYSSLAADRDSSLIADLEEKSNTLEKELTRTVAGFGEARRQVNWQEVQATLQPREAAIEFVHYRFYENESTDSIIYAALLLLPGENAPTFLPLFEEQALASLVETSGERRVDYINKLYAFAERGMVAESEPQTSLYELIWKPLEQALSGIQTVYFSPSGLLHRINLNAIAVDEESNLVDHYTLIEMNSTRQLVIPTVITAATNDAVLFGGIQYELDSMAMLAIQAEMSIRDIASRGNMPDQPDEGLSRGGTWNELKWTMKEVESIDEVLQAGGYSTTVLKDYQASEDAFRSIGEMGASPQVIHLATHGYFVPDPETASDADEAEPVFKISDNPMIRSGLILAGGNQAWQNKSTLEGMEDGILTAYEISQMNLSNTELVVLSACETGLGDIQGNEGVYGLQRAFKIAGAKYLIMSLWQVPDRQTMEFMTTFYRNWLENGMTIPEAFRKTQLKMRDRFFDAYNWAGFVLVE